MNEVTLYQLSPIEKKIVQNVGKTFAQMDAREAMQEAGRSLTFAARDVGYNIKQDWPEITARLTSVLIDYYGGFTPDDILVAFEMLAVGELDEFITDKEHYQNFSSAYLARVLNAYRRKKNIIKAKLNPPKPVEISDKQKKIYYERTARIVKEVFERYKTFGVLQFSTKFSDLVVVAALADAGLATEITAGEQAESLSTLGAVNKSIAARIKAAFDKIIAEKIDINTIV